MLTSAKMLSTTKDKPKVIKWKKWKDDELPTVIEWQGMRYVLDMKGTK